MDEREKLMSLMEEISREFNLDLKTEKITDLIAVIDEELDNCIKKLRIVVYGHEARTAIIEYEELMLKKADLIAYGLFMKEKEAMQRCVKRMQWCSRTRGWGK